MKNGTWNGKIKSITMITVAWYDDRGWFVAPKLPGLQTINVRSAQAGRRQADNLWGEWFLSITL
jgi:hypothetical protein